MVIKYRKIYCHLPVFVNDIVLILDLYNYMGNIISSKDKFIILSVII